MPGAIPDSYISGGAYMAPAQNPSTGDPTREATSAKAGVIDGTPSRVAAIGILAIAVLVGFRMSGVKFNVTVGS